MSVRCPTCDQINADGAAFCSQCATNISAQAGGVRYNPYASAPVPQQYGGYGAHYPIPSRGSTILTLGILSLVLCSVMGPIAWSMGNEELRRIDSGQTDPTQRGSVTAGRVCGIVATVLLGVSVLMVIMMFALTASVAHR